MFPQEIILRTRASLGRIRVLLDRACDVEVTIAHTACFDVPEGQTACGVGVGGVH